MLPACVTGFVDVVIHSYRHRFGLVDGDPRRQQAEDLLAASPTIAVPTIVLEAPAAFAQAVLDVRQR